MSGLVDLLRRRLRMLREDAQAVAHTVEQAFHGDDEVEDDVLDKDLRQLFYDLQDEKILDVRRQEYTKDGQLLRGYFWHLRDDVGEMPRPEHALPSPEEQLYRKLRDNAWERRPRE